MVLKLRKTAISVAAVAAITGPFIFNTYTMTTKSDYWVPLSEGGKERIRAYLKSTNNCQDLADSAAKTEDPRTVEALRLCQLDIKHLKEHGATYTYPSVPKYLAVNAAVVVASCIVVYSLAFALTAFSRRWWRWLHT
jgi:hypothetical protein